MQKRVVGLLSIRTVSELVEVKSPMADESFANEVYNMPYAKGHRAVNDLELPALTGRT